MMSYYKGACKHCALSVTAIKLVHLETVSFKALVGIMQRYEHSRIAKAT